jgi:hypothetical protein
MFCDLSTMATEANACFRRLSILWFHRSNRTRGFDESLMLRDYIQYELRDEFNFYRY